MLLRFLLFSFFRSSLRWRETQYPTTWTLAHYIPAYCFSPNSSVACRKEWILPRGPFIVPKDSIFSFLYFFLKVFDEFRLAKYMEECLFPDWHFLQSKNTFISVSQSCRYCQHELLKHLSHCYHSFSTIFLRT